MRSNVVRGAIFVGVVVLLLPILAFAQEAALSGVVTDSTGAVLPGVTVTAVNQASGNTFTAVTDGRGAYQIPIRVGTYKVTTELTGFRTLTRDGIEVLVGQTATVDMRMSAGAAETITVTAETPLVE